MSEHLPSVNGMIAALEKRHGSGAYAFRAPALVSGRGAEVTDADGRTYLDCATGQGVASLGHGHPRIAEALARQAARIVTVFASFPNDVRATLLERWSRLLPARLDRFFLCNSGTEAVEAAIKVARWTTKRPGVVAAVNAFHGRTLGALSATHKPHYRDGFAPLVPGFVHAPFDKLDAWAAAIDGQTAAAIVEVVQGEGGVRVASAEFLAGLQELCRERGALLIADEVQSGFGRTGRLFAFEHFDLAPDLVCMGKAIAGGVPMGALAIGPRVPSLEAGIHGSTFGGNALACAAALAALDVLEDEKLVENAAREGEWLRERIASFALPVVREVRGLGLMIGVELKVPAAPAVAALEQQGILALVAGKNVLRLLPPLCIRRDQVERAAEGVATVLRGMKP